MPVRPLVRAAALALLSLSLPRGPALVAQAHQHSPGMTHDLAQSGPLPTSGGQAAFAAISEVVRLLSQDTTTDWSKVDIEALRQHLIDMDNVIMRAESRATPVDGGVSLEVRGQGAVLAAIRRMVGNHTRELDAMPAYRAVATPLDGGMRLVVTARTPGDVRTERRIRALGLAGLLAEGEHHAAHHLMVARGESPHTP